MRVLRYFLISGSAAVVAGSLMLATQATVTTAAAPDHAVTQPSARFLAQARAALVSYLSTNQQAPPFTSGNPGAKTVNQPASTLTGTAATASFNWSGYADVSKTANTFTKVSGQWKARLDASRPRTSRSWATTRRSSSSISCPTSSTWSPAWSPRPSPAFMHAVTASACRNGGSW